MSDEIDKQQEIEEKHSNTSSVRPPKGSQVEDKASPGNDIHNAGPKDTAHSPEVSVATQPLTALPAVNPTAGATVGTSPIMQELNGLETPAQVNEEVFEEIPVKVCGQLYQTTLEVGFSLKNKGMPMRELPEARVNTQAEIIYGILKKNQISIKHIDLFMLGAGMMSDWKYMGTLADEKRREDVLRGKPLENADGK